MFVETFLFEIIATAILLVVLIVLRLLSVALIKRFGRRSNLLEHRTGLIVKYIDYTAIFLMMLGTAMIWGVQVQDLGWVLSSVFAIIGIGFFAQWSILSNLTSGVIMFFTFPYKIGDYIIVHDSDYNFEGFIEDIRAFQVIIKTQAGEIITYPNSMMLQKGVTVIKPDHFDDIPTIEEDKNVKEQPID